MERFRGLRGFVQRLGGGDGIGGGGVGGVGGVGGGEAMGTREQTEEILENLPLTREFVEQLPRSLILQTAASNDIKATEALQLIQRIDDLITSHTTTAHDLRDHVSQITTLTTTLSTATTHAAHLHTQLLELTSIISTLEASQSTTGLTDLQSTEDRRFESYARKRRAEVSEKRKEYQRQLEAFERERVGLGVVESAQEGVRLENVVLEGEGGLDDFLGGGEVRDAPVRKRKEAPKGKKRMVVLADEDIDDEEEVKRWY